MTTMPITDTLPPFAEFPSIARLARDVVVTEKIDGTNAQVTVLEDGRVLAGSRNRWITSEQDNFGFARWVALHADELRASLGVGTHYGEWWGAGIQRRYGLLNDDKRFSLFNTGRWHSLHNQGDTTSEGTNGPHTRCIECPCCHVVPVLMRHTFDTAAIETTLDGLRNYGSVASPGFMKPEGIVVFHASSRTLFKKTLDKDDAHKGAAQ